MNWRRGLFRLWIIGSVLWATGYVVYFWRSCGYNQIGELWCPTGYEDWIGHLSYFGLLDYGRHAAWAVGFPIIVLVIAAAFLWVFKGFGPK
jgi:hypothetical protein